MKRVIAIVLVAAACLSMAACGGKSAGGKQPATADVVKAVADSLTFKDAMMTVEDEVVSTFYAVDEAKVAEKTMYTSATRATAEEVTVFKAKTAADVDAIKSALQTRVEDQRLAYESYMPAEMPKINAALIATSGNYVILVMADDMSGADATFKAQF